MLNSFIMGNLNELNIKETDLGFPENDFRTTELVHLGRDTELNEIDLRTTNVRLTNLSDLRTSFQKNDLLTIEIVQDKDSSEFVGELECLKQIEEKDSLINELREEIINMREKLNKSNHKKVKLLKEKVEKIELKLTHWRQKYDILKKNSSETKKYLEKENKELEEMYVTEKIKSQTNLSEIQTKEIALLKQIKILNYQIGLYEKQITSFNMKKKKKKIF